MKSNPGKAGGDGSADALVILDDVDPVIPVADALMNPDADAHSRGMGLFQDLRPHPSKQINNREIQAGHALLRGLAIAVVEALF